LSSTSTILCNYHNTTGVAKEALKPWSPKYIISIISLLFCQFTIGLTTTEWTWWCHRKASNNITFVWYAQQHAHHTKFTPPKVF